MQIKALTTLELAVCAAPGKGTFPTRLIAPQDIDAQARGKGHNQRYVHNILPEDQPADSLLVVEVWTHEGCTSSYPSHKHDTDNPPQETYLEETYYHRLNPGQGFCMQRVYTDDRSLDECMAVYNRDVVMVPKGYHPVATLAGYDSYYLNVMAGPVRKWMFTGKTITRGSTATIHVDVAEARTPRAFYHHYPVLRVTHQNTSATSSPLRQSGRRPASPRWHTSSWCSARPDRCRRHKTAYKARPAGYAPRGGRERSGSGW